MRLLTHSGLVVALLAGPMSEVCAQGPAKNDGLTAFVPLRPQTRQELAQREARKLYAQGLLRQHEDRLLEATRMFEEALQLDPEAPPLYRALIPLYLALSRTEDALAACRKTLDLEPGDYETWSLYARQLKHQGRPKEAREALSRALACQGLADHVDLRLQMYYDLGVLCEEAQDYDQAVAAFSELVKILTEPQTALELGDVNRTDLGEEAANTYERIIKLCIQAHQYDRALRIFGEAQKPYPALAARLNYNLAKVYLAQGQPAKALVHLDDYLKKQPQGADAYELRISILKQLGRANEIVPSLEEYAERDRFNVPLRLLLARHYAAAGQAGNAEEVYDHLADHSPTPEIFQGLFALYRQARDMDKVISLLDEAIGKSEKSERRPGGDAQAAAKARAMLSALRDDAELVKALLPVAQHALLSGREFHAQTRYFLAVLAARTHQLAEAELFYRRCLNGALGNPQREVAVYIGLIQVLWSARKFEDVVEVCRQGLRQAQTTNHLLFRRYLPRALVILGKVDEALAEADKGVDTADDNMRLEMRLSRMSVLTQAGRYPQAIAEGQALFEAFTQPDDIRAIRDSLHNVYTAMRDFPKAEEQLQLILKADPNDATANNNLGYVWADQGKNLDEAERLIRKALDLDRQQKRIGSAVTIEGDKENAAFVDSLGWVLFRKGRLEEARGWLEKATELARGEDDPTVWDHLGDVNFRLRNLDEARTAWQKSLLLYEAEKRRQTDEHYKELKHKLELLDSETHQP